MADDQPREANVDTERGEEQVISSAPEGNGSINRSPSTNRKAKPEESMTHPKPDVAPSSSRTPSNGAEATNKRAKFTRGQSSGNNRSREASGGRVANTSSSSKPQQVVDAHSSSVNNGRGKRQQQSSRNDEEEILTMSSDSSSHQDEQDHSDQYNSVEEDDSYSASQSQSESDDQRDHQREERHGKRRRDESSDDASYDSGSGTGIESHSDEERAKEPIEDVSFVAKTHHWTASSKRNIKLFPLAYPIFVVVPKVIKPSWIQKLLNDELRTILQMPPFAVFYNVARKNDADFCRAITSNIFALPLFGVPTLGVDSRYANGLISNMSIEKLAPLSSVSPYTATSDRYSYLVFIDAALYKMVPQKDWVKSECPVIDISESKHVTTKKQTEEDRDTKRSKRATHQEQPSSKKRSDEKRTSRPSKDESSSDDREERRKQPSKSDKQPSKRSSPTPEKPTRKPSSSNANRKPKSDNRQAKTSGKGSSVKRDTTSHPSIASTFFVNDESSSSSNDDAGVFDMVVKTPATRSGNTNGKSKQAPTSPSHRKSRDDHPSEHRSSKKRPTSEPRKSRQQDGGNGRTQERPSSRKQDESKGARPQPHQERQSKSTSNRRN